MEESENLAVTLENVAHQDKAAAEAFTSIFEKFTCRICLYRNQNNAEIFGSQARNVDLIEKISKHLSIEVSQEDDFPKWVCRYCLNSLESFHNFHSKVKQIQDSLCDLLASLKNASSSDLLKSEAEKIQMIESTVGFGRTKKARLRNKRNEDLHTQGVRRSSREKKSKKWESSYSVASSLSKDTDYEVIIKEEPVDPLSLEGALIEVDSINLPNSMQTSSIFTKDDDLSSLEDQDWVGQGINFMSDLDSHGSENDTSWKPSHSIKSSKAGSCETLKKRSRKKRRRKVTKVEGAGNGANLENAMEKNDFSDDDELQSESKKTAKLRITATHGTMPKPKIAPGTRKALRAQINAMMLQFYGFTCDICENEIHNKPAPSEPLKYESFEALCVHMQTEHNERGYVKCCNCTMRDTKRAERHMLLHTQPGSVYKCNICAKQLSSQQSFRCHILLHLPDSERPYRCNQCERGFVTRADLAQHEHQHLPDDKRFSYTCDICGHRFSYESGLVVHKQRVHENTRSHLCDLCAKSFNSRSDMERHREQIHGNVKREQCNECGKWFKGKSILKTHMRRHRGAVYECQYCGKKYSVRSSWKAHLLKHSDEKPHQCPVCAKSFKLPGTLKMHLNQHTGDLPYPCPFCPKKFASSGNYYTHRKRMHREQVAIMKEAAAASLAANGIPPDPPLLVSPSRKLSDALAKAKEVAECMMATTETQHFGVDAAASAGSNTTPVCVVTNPSAVRNLNIIAQPSTTISSSTMVQGNNSVSIPISPVSLSISQGTNGALVMTTLNNVATNSTLTSVPVSAINSIIQNIQVVPNLAHIMKPLTSELCPTTGLQVVTQGVHVMHPLNTTPVTLESGAQSLQCGHDMPQEVEDLNTDLNLLPSAIN